MIAPFLLLQRGDSIRFYLFGKSLFVERGRNLQEGDPAVVILSVAGKHVEFKIGLRMFFQHGGNLERTGKGRRFVLITHATVRQVYLDDLSYRVCLSEQLPGARFA